MAVYDFDLPYLLEKIKGYIESKASNAGSTASFTMADLWDASKVPDIVEVTDKNNPDLSALGQQFRPDGLWLKYPSITHGALNWEYDPYENLEVADTTVTFTFADGSTINHNIRLKLNNANYLVTSGLVAHDGAYIDTGLDAPYKAHLTIEGEVNSGGTNVFIGALYDNTHRVTVRFQPTSNKFQVMRPTNKEILAETHNTNLLRKFTFNLTDTTLSITQNDVEKCNISMSDLSPNIAFDSTVDTNFLLYAENATSTYISPRIDYIKVDLYGGNSGYVYEFIPAYIDSTYGFIKIHDGDIDPIRFVKSQEYRNQFSDRFLTPPKGYLSEY